MAVTWSELLRLSGAEDFKMQKSNHFLPLQEKTCHCETRGASRSNLGQKQILRPSLREELENDISFLVTTCCRGVVSAPM